MRWASRFLRSWKKQVSSRKVAELPKCSYGAGPLIPIGTQTLYMDLYVALSALGSGQILTSFESPVARRGWWVARRRCCCCWLQQLSQRFRIISRSGAAAEDPILFLTLKGTSQKQKAIPQKPPAYQLLSGYVRMSLISIDNLDIFYHASWDYSIYCRDSIFTVEFTVIESPPLLFGSGKRCNTSWFASTGGNHHTICRSAGWFLSFYHIDMIGKKWSHIVFPFLRFDREDGNVGTTAFFLEGCPCWWNIVEPAGPEGPCDSRSTAVGGCGFTPI